MAEFNIKRTKTGPNKPGAYDAGSIIEVHPDGYFDDKPYITVLKVPGLDHLKVEKLMSETTSWVEQTFTVAKSKWQKVKAVLEQQNIDDTGTVSVYGGEFRNITAEFDGGDTITVTAERKVMGIRRRFIIPPAVMSALFPDGTYHRTVSKAAFLNNLDLIRDRAHGNAPLTSTAWYAAYKAGL